MNLFGNTIKCEDCDGRGGRCATCGGKGKVPRGTAFRRSRQDDDAPAATLGIDPLGVLTPGSPLNTALFNTASGGNTDGGAKSDDSGVKIDSSPVQQETPSFSAPDAPSMPTDL